MQERQTNKAHTTEIGSTESWSIAAAGTPSVPAKAQHTHTATDVTDRSKANGNIYVMAIYVEGARMDFFGDCVVRVCVRCV